MKRDYPMPDRSDTRSATPLEIEVHGAESVKLRAVVGHNEQLEFWMTDAEVAELWNLLHKVRERALRDVIFQNMSDEEAPGPCK